MRGQGFSSCLICKDDSSLMLGSKIAQRLIKGCYGTDEYETMICATKICFCCIGRLHQLHRFLIRKETMSETHKEMTGLTCKFCYETYDEDELIMDQMQSDIRNIVVRTLFADEFQSNEMIKCCYSCINLLLQWAEYREIMKECHTVFLNSLGNCKVMLNGKPSTSIKQEETSEGLIKFQEIELHNNSSDITIPETDRIDPLPEIETPELAQENVQIDSTDRLTEIQTTEQIEIPQRDYIEPLQNSKFDNINSPEKNIPMRRNRRASRGRLSIALKANVEDTPKEIRRSRRETSLPYNKRQQLDENLNVALSQKQTRSRSKSYTPAAKKLKKSPELSELELFKLHKIKPCSVVVEKLPIIKTPPPQNKKQIKKREKKPLKLKLTPKNKKKSQLTKKKGKKSKKLPATKIKDEPKTRNSPDLIITEDLPATLEITEDFTDSLIEEVSEQGDHPSNIDHEEVVAGEAESTIMREYTEIEFLSEAHRNKGTADESSTAQEINNDESKNSSDKENINDEETKIIPTSEA